MALPDITDSLGTDIAHVGDFLLAANGDLQTISGLANLKRALFHRLITVPGTLVHRPTYGCGIALFQNAVNSFENQQKIANLIQDQFGQDPRVKSVNSIYVSLSDEKPELTTIAVFVTPVGYTEQSMTFTPFSGVTA